MQTKRNLVPVLFLAAMLLVGCARGERARNGSPDPAGQAAPSSDVTELGEKLEGDLDELDRMLGDLEEELLNTDTQVEIP